MSTESNAIDANGRRVLGTVVEAVLSCGDDKDGKILELIMMLPLFIKPLAAAKQQRWQK